MWFPCTQLEQDDETDTAPLVRLDAVRPPPDDGLPGYDTHSADKRANSAAAAAEPLPTYADVERIKLTEAL